MGAWDYSVAGNDTAQDLKSEYRVAFYYYKDIDSALRKIDQYVREEGFNESDESEWCDYYFSLADFMWSKGILTETVKNEALRLIDNGFGLDIWKESGEKALSARRKALQKFRDKITSELPPRKKIKVDMQTNPIFERGDIVTFQLQTKGKTYNAAHFNNVKESDFYEADGKYIAVRKIYDFISWKSRIEPSVCNVWATFQLYDKVFGELPALDDVIKLETVHFPIPDYVTCPEAKANLVYGLFYSESRMFYFRKRKYIVLGNNQENIDGIISDYTSKGERNFFRTHPIYFGINNEWHHADAEFLNNITNR